MTKYELREKIKDCESIFYRFSVEKNDHLIFNINTTCLQMLASLYDCAINYEDQIQFDNVLQFLYSEMKLKDEEFNEFND